MSTERITITIPPETLAVVREAAERAGLSVSAWLSRAAEHAAWLEEGKAALAEALAEVGPISEEDHHWAQEAVQHALAHQLAVERAASAATNQSAADAA